MDSGGVYGVSVRVCVWCGGVGWVVGLGGRGGAGVGLAPPPPPASISSPP